MVTLAMSRNEDDLVCDAIWGVLVEVLDMFGKGRP
jgi:hypothetical protein